MKRLVEIRSYALKPDSGAAFQKLFLEKAFPLLREWGFDVVAFGRSEHDVNAYYLIRTFNDLAHLQASEDSFYGSDAWRKGPREEILAHIDSYLDTVLWLSPSAIEELRTFDGINRLGG